MIPARMLFLAARLLAALMLLAPLAVPSPALADPADIDAAARGVVRVVVIERESGRVTPVSHGTGFAVAPERVVTNAHVIREAQQDPSLVLGIVPSDGEDAVYARVVDISDRNDLALLATTARMNLPPLTIAGNPPIDAGAVTSVGYPMNVDRAQGLAIEDIFRAQPPVKSTGFLSGRRPVRDFDSLLHTAPIARGNSGGPLLDDCGRVIGVNSFGAESGGADAEFFFAVSTRELLPFLRANDIAPAINAMPCRSLAELDAEERARAERQQRAAAARAEQDAAALATRREEARRSVEFGIMEQRENGMALSFLLTLLALAAGAYALFVRERELPGDEDTEDDDEPNRAVVVATWVAVLALVGAVAAWLLRPGFDEVEDRLDDRLHREIAADEAEALAGAATAGTLACVLDPQRSRVTGAPAQDLPLSWSAQGCVNDRTQYVPLAGDWTRVFMPEDEAAVSVNRFDPQAREYRVERYLLGREALARAREARGEYEAPQCGTDPETLRQFAAQQQAVLAALPTRPNERLTYRCSPAL